MKPADLLKLFGHNNIFLEADIRRLEEEHDIDLGHRREDPEAYDQEAFPQFREQLRNEAMRMAQHYVVFYCLENYIREMIKARLFEEHGADWWNAAVPEGVRKNAQDNQNKEKKAGVTPRSTELIDYTNFGELSDIINFKWDVFGDMFRDKSAVQRTISNLNTLRGPIAHCKPLAEDEVTRLHLALRDWFRQMS
jgi:HEPN superfamily Swt1-like protein